MARSRREASDVTGATSKPATGMTCVSGFRPTRRTKVEFEDEAKGAFGYGHSYETSSRYDGPGLRVVLFVSGCLLRCTYCHNPDTWHLKDGTYVSAQQVLDRLAGFAPALRALDGGLTISGGEPMVQLAFTKRIFAGAKEMGLHTAIETSGFLGDRADDDYLSQSTWSCSTSRARIPTPIARSPAATLRRRCGLPSASPRWASRFGSASRLYQATPTTLRMSKASPNFVAPMKNVEWVEIQPFHQMGSFKWKAMNLEYKCADTLRRRQTLIARVIEQFRTAGCRVR